MIRIATERDLPELTEIYNEAIEKTVATFDTEKKTIDQRKEWLLHHSSKHPVWVYEKDGNVVAWSCLSEWSDRCAYSGTVENSVYVLEKFQGQGIGKKLMRTLVAFAREQEFKTILARISDGNEASIRLHKNFGFETIGVMKQVGYKFDRWIDVLMMQLLF